MRDKRLLILHAQHGHLCVNPRGERGPLANLNPKCLHVCNNYLIIFKVCFGTTIHFVELLVLARRRSHRYAVPAIPKNTAILTTSDYRYE